MLQRLFPVSDRPVTSPIKGFYLDQALHRQADDGELLIYGNYIASLDGRISIYDPSSREFSVPDTLANKRDWYLYQELAAQSDILITSARYFRQLAKGRAQDLLPVGSEPDYAHLLEWRIKQGLAPQPSVAIMSRTLDIPLSSLEALKDRGVYIFTVESAPEDRRTALQASGVEVIPVGDRDVDALMMRRELIRFGFRSAYMIAGPQVHHTLIAAGAVDRLFLTTRFLLLGGQQYHTICEGELERPQNMRLDSLYFDRECNQIFSQFVME